MRTRRIVVEGSREHQARFGFGAPTEVYTDQGYRLFLHAVFDPLVFPGDVEFHDRQAKLYDDAVEAQETLRTEGKGP
jgi:hypothetical protein